MGKHSMKNFVVVNPASANGRTGKHWPRIKPALEDAIGPFDLAMTTGRGTAAGIVADALARGARTVIAVGGDGTINEALNGLCSGEAPPPKDVTFGIVTSGTGGDFRRSFDVASGPAAAIERLKRGGTRPIDLGLLRFVDATGTQVTRWFGNIASFGFSGEVVRAVNEAGISRYFGGKISFLWNSIVELHRYAGCKVELKVDDTIVTDDFCTIAVCNGKYFGGGMMIAPDADPADGIFDVVAIRQNPPVTLLDLRLLYSGAHLSHPNVFVLRGKRVEARALSNAPVRLDVEGEGPGGLPARFELVPAALNFRC